MKISKMTVKKLYIPLITSVVGLLLGFSAEAQFKTVPQAKTIPVKSIPDVLKKPLLLKAKELNLILVGDNLPKKLILKTKEVDGPRTGGGNGCALSITQNKIKLLNILSEEKIVTKADLSQMQEKLQTTKYYVVADRSKMVLNGETKDAINSPSENIIYFSEHFCRTEMGDVSARSMSLLFHEYLGLTGIDDSKYQKSGQFLESMSKRNQANNELIEFLKSEIENDLNQQQSLFKGQMASFKAKTKDIYGDKLLNEESPLIEVMKIRTSSPDILNKFVSKKYDVYWNATEDTQKAIYGIFDSFENESFVVTVKYKASTVRSFETATKEFLLKKEVYSQEARTLSFAVHAAAQIQIPKKITDSLINKTTYSVRTLDTDDKD